MNDQISRHKLKPCPFCGEKAFLDTDENWYWKWKVECPGCGCDLGYYDTEEEVVEARNKRVEPPASPWIPCSKREPEDPCIYTVEDCSLYTVNKFGSPQRYVWKVLPPMFGTNYRLVAWKPVDPEPYKGE